MIDLEFGVSQQDKEYQLAGAKFSCTLMYMWEPSLVAVAHVPVGEPFSEGIAVLMLLWAHVRWMLLWTAFQIKNWSACLNNGSHTKNSTWC